MRVGEGNGRANNVRATRKNVSQSSAFASKPRAVERTRTGGAVPDGFRGCLWSSENTQRRVFLEEIFVSVRQKIMPATSFLTFPRLRFSVLWLTSFG